MTASDDRDLSERFAALRDEDTACAPPLSSVLRGRAATPAAFPSRWLPVTALAAGTTIAAIVLVWSPRGAKPSLDEAIAQAQSISSWTAPTDEWLTLSGLEIPNSVPSLSLSSVTLPETSTAETEQGDSQ